LLGPSAGHAGGENAIREPKTRLRDENQTKQKRFDMRRGTIAANYQGEVKGVLTLRFPGEAKSDLPPISWTPDQAAWRSAFPGVM
jgi:hypothetical protein